MYGFEPKSPIAIVLEKVKERKARDFLYDMQEMLELAKDSIRTTRDPVTTYANQKRSPRTLEGVHPSIREEVWEFLLGCFAVDSTYVERAALRKSRRDKYLQIKAGCQAMDSAVGSGTVVTLPRISENGTVTDGCRKHPEIEGKSPPSNSNSFETGEMLPRSLLSLLQQDEIRKESNAIQVCRDIDEKQTTGPAHLAQVNSNTAVQVGRILARQDIDKVAIGNSAPENKVVQWRLTLHQIGLDVVRTDRTLEFYEKPSNLAKLWDILAVYSWLDPDIGYCQGMSDLCSPMVVLFQNEADAFWCFERLMHRLRENFRCTDQAVGVQKQLANLGFVLQLVDPKLYKHLDDLGGGSFIFAFRMLMVLFRREFSFSDSLFLWEIMWSLEFDPNLGLHEDGSFQQQQHVHVSKQVIRNGWIVRRGKALYRWGKFERQNIKYGQADAHDIPFVVFCAASIFESQRLRLQEAVGLDEVLKLLNDITGKLDAKKACKEALKIHKKYLLKAATQSRLR
ncbi:hypothetical protein GOP47_0025448 [Adiantum capillus-veneris]|uniref:Rab-GAP TBC domain-containing protein n=1 Tax=Adiantum capillus-veneris TaxID=13818 RepID=A0A9D4U256_ADICA|nr:hypothetical protein GOP47_0025448 [Adiantum capillus-veneris]